MIESQKATRKRNRPNAFRSCKGCKEQKKRCELKESILLIEPSTNPVKEEEACSRCFILGLPCILDDFEKIEKIASKRRKDSIQRQQKEQHYITPTESVPNEAFSAHQSHTPTPSSGPPTFPADLQEFKRYTPRSRPITLVSELSIRQPNFAAQSNALAQEWDRYGKSSYELIDDTLAHRLSVWCEEHLLIWLPQLPNPDHVRRARLQGQHLSAPIRVLEAAQYLIALQHSSQQVIGKQLLITSLTRKIESLLSQLIFTSQRDLHAAQAMELLTVFPIASAFLTQSDHGKVRSLEMAVLAGNAYRIASICKQEYQSKEGENRTMNEREFEIGLQWCSSATWEFSHCMGSDDVIRFWGNRNHPSIDYVGSLLQYLRLHLTITTKGLGQLFVLLRAHLMAITTETWQKLRKEAPFVHTRVRRSPERTNKERLEVLGKILKEFEEDCEQSKALRYTWLESHRLPEAQLVLNWLDLEGLAFFLMISGCTLYYALQEDENADEVIQFTPDFLYKMISGKASNELIREFVFYHGDNRIDTGESILMVASSLASLQFSPQRDLVVPTLTTCGYIMEACMLGMEMHGTSARYWQTLPRRSTSWQTGIKGSIAMLKKIKDVPEEQGGITTTISRIIGGMAEVIGVWRRAITKARISQSSLKDQTPSQIDENTECSQNLELVGGIDVSIPPLITDEEEVLSLDQLLQDLFGSTDWLDVLPSVEGRLGT